MRGAGGFPRGAGEIGFEVVTAEAAGVARGVEGGEGELMDIAGGEAN